MRSKLLAVLLLGVLLNLTLAQGDSRTILQQANDAYIAGDYSAAIGLYETLIASGYADAVVFFNLGNAYFESDDLGRALVNYKRAQRFIPRDSDLDRNLALTRALRVDVLGDETALIDNLAAATESVMTVGELSVLTFLVWSFWFGCVGVMIVKPELRRRIRTLWLGLTLMLCAAGVLLVGRVYVDSQRPAATIVAFQIQMMSGPGEDYVPLFTLYSAAEGRVLERHNGWVRLLLPDGRQGWIRETDIEIV